MSSENEQSEVCKHNCPVHNYDTAYDMIHYGRQEGYAHGIELLLDLMIGPLKFDFEVPRLHKLERDRLKKLCVCSQYPLCDNCDDATDSTPLRVCGDCYTFEWDESNYCGECGEELNHNHEADSWGCENWCGYEGEYPDFDEETWQERRRRDYYVSKYGEY